MSSYTKFQTLIGRLATLQEENADLHERGFKPS